MFEAIALSLPKNDKPQSEILVEPSVGDNIEIVIAVGSEDPILTSLDLLYPQAINETQNA